MFQSQITHELLVSSITKRREITWRHSSDYERSQTLFSLSKDTILYQHLSAHKPSQFMPRQGRLVHNWLFHKNLNTFIKSGPAYQEGKGTFCRSQMNYSTASTCNHQFQPLCTTNYMVMVQLLPSLKNLCKHYFPKCYPIFVAKLCHLLSNNNF